jgi:hypothetical protein
MAAASARYCVAIISAQIISALVAARGSSC